MYVNYNFCLLLLDHVFVVIFPQYRKSISFVYLWNSSNLEWKWALNLKIEASVYPAVVAWFAKASVSHSVDSAPSVKRWIESPFGRDSTQHENK